MALQGRDRSDASRETPGSGGRYRIARVPTAVAGFSGSEKAARNEQMPWHETV